MSPCFWFGAKKWVAHVLQLALRSLSSVRKYLCKLQQNMPSLIKSNSECLTQALEKAKPTLVLSISCKIKDCYRDFSIGVIGQFGFGSRSILRSQTVYARSSSKVLFLTSELANEAEITILSARDTTRAWVSGRALWVEMYGYI